MYYTILIKLILLYHLYLCTYFIVCWKNDINRYFLRIFNRWNYVNAGYKLIYFLLRVDKSGLFYAGFFVGYIRPSNVLFLQCCLFNYLSVNDVNDVNLNKCFDFNFNIITGRKAKLVGSIGTSKYNMQVLYLKSGNT